MSAENMIHPLAQASFLKAYYIFVLLDDADNAFIPGENLSKFGKGRLPKGCSRFRIA